MAEVYVAEHHSRNYGVTNYCKQILIFLFYFPLLPLFVFVRNSCRSSSGSSFTSLSATSR